MAVLGSSYQSYELIDLIKHNDEPKDYKAIYLQLFGVAAPVGATSANLVGTGHPVVTTIDADQILATQVRLRATITTNLSTGAHVRFAYTTDVALLTGITYTTPVFMASNGTATTTVTGLTTGQTYYFWAESYNNYIQSTRTADYISDKTGFKWFQPQPIQLSTPTMTSASAAGFNAFEVIFSDSNGANAPSYESRLRINGGSWDDNTDVLTDTNWGSSNTSKEGVWEFYSLFNFGDFVEVQVRANNPNPNYSASAWSSIGSFFY